MLHLRSLSKRVAREVTPDETGDRVLLITREEPPERSRGLRRSTYEELCSLHSGLCGAIPDDFDFAFYLGEDGFGAHLTYDDGPMAGAGVPFPVGLDDRMMANLKHLGWDDLRGEMLPMTNMHDDIADAAYDMPKNIPCTQTAQSVHLDRLRQFADKTKENAPAFAVLACKEYEEDDESDEEDEDFEIEFCESFFRDKSTLLGEMGDLMTFRFTIIAVVSDGVLLALPDIEAIKQEALKGLGPISRAKAEGRFGAVLGMMQS